MNTPNQHPTRSESASTIAAVFSTITRTVRRTESTVLTNLILAATLLIVIFFVAHGNHTRSEADPVTAAPSLNHSATFAGALPFQLAGSDIFSTRSGYAEFTAELHGTVGVFAGDSRRLGGTIDLRNGTFDFHLYLKTLSTGIPERDTGLQDALNMDDHPFAEFSGSFQPSFDPSSEAKQHVTAAGEFTLNGITRILEIPVTLQPGENGIHMEAEWMLNITEYGIYPPVFLSVTVSDQQEIRLKATLEPQLLVSID
ncbi:MAG: YceI family protein [Bacteroidota bacterium]